MFGDMKVKYFIYFFTFCLMSSFAIFIADELLEAHADYRENQLALYKINRAKEISEAFQASLQAHRLKRLSLINPQITRAQCQAADRLARDKIALIRPPPGNLGFTAAGRAAKNRRAVDDRPDGTAAGQRQSSAFAG
ncbi:Uncharacterised protein [Serratia ficaria]|nr:Uncharacterised protein [Serratia ficaria]